MKINVKYIAKLANLPLSKKEENKFGRQLEETLSYIGNLKEISTENVKPTSQVTGLENITREDIVKPSLTQEEVLSNTKSQHNGLFKVDAILGSES